MYGCKSSVLKKQKSIRKIRISKYEIDNGIPREKIAWLARVHITNGRSYERPQYRHEREDEDH